MFKKVYFSLIILGSLALCLMFMACSEEPPPPPPPADSSSSFEQPQVFPDSEIALRDKGTEINSFNELVIKGNVYMTNGTFSSNPYSIDSIALKIRHIATDKVKDIELTNKNWGKNYIIGNWNKTNLGDCSLDVGDYRAYIYAWFKPDDESKLAILDSVPFTKTSTMTDPACTNVTITVTVSPPNTGTISRNPDTDTYLLNSSVTLTANPNPNYAFIRWEEGQPPWETASPLTFTIKESRTLVAKFAQSRTIAEVSFGGNKISPRLFNGYCVNLGAGTASSSGNNCDFTFEIRNTTKYLTVAIGGIISNFDDGEGGALTLSKYKSGYGADEISSIGKTHKFIPMESALTEKQFNTGYYYVIQTSSNWFLVLAEDGSNVDAIRAWKAQ